MIEGFAKAINTNKIEAKNAEKAQFTVVNAHFEAFFNEDVGSRMGFEKAFYTNENRTEAVSSTK
jgi:hypothetical protein